MEDLFKELPQSDCKGEVFRGYRSTFYHKGRIETKQGIRHLKSKSCPGCDHCGWLLDEISDAIANDCLLMPEIENGKLYSIRVTNIETDWESGNVDAYDLEVYQLEDAN